MMVGEDMIIGIGCDIVKLERIEKAMDNPGFLRILTEKEAALFDSLKSHRQVEWIAGRFAAKEAIVKAIASVEDMVLSQIEVLYEENRPICELAGYHVHISIAHEVDYAIAYAIVERGE